MKNQMNSKLILWNDQCDNSKMVVFPDTSDNDLVGFVFLYKDKPLTMRGEPVSDSGQEYFHLDKFNTGCLIDFLKRIYDDMD